MLCVFIQKDRRTEKHTHVRQHAWSGIMFVSGYHSCSPCSNSLEEVVGQRDMWVLGKLYFHVCYWQQWCLAKQIFMGNLLCLNSHLFTYHSCFLFWIFKRQLSVCFLIFAPVLTAFFSQSWVWFAFQHPFLFVLPHCCRLSGYSPFVGEEQRETFALVNNADYDFDDDTWDNVSADAKDFIKRLLIKDKKWVSVFHSY